MYVRHYIYKYVYKCVCVCLAGWLSGCVGVWLSGCLAVWLSGCLAVWLAVCPCVCMHACMHVCMYVRTYIHCIKLSRRRLYMYSHITHPFYYEYSFNIFEASNQLQPVPPKPQLRDCVNAKESNSTYGW